MVQQPVVFIALKEFDNLGVGYIAAILSEEGFDTRIIDFRTRKEDILRILHDLDPLIVGFSVIYQYHISQFIDLVGYLRDGGIKCHFTAGGHYASIRYKELFELIPGLDSVVRFEGEYTFTELVKKISSGADWQNTDGIAFRSDGHIIDSPLRPLEKDLDKFPFPLRSFPASEYAFTRKFATIIAGRGCVHACSFCNLKEFFRMAGGPMKRLRDPRMVVKEIKWLYAEKGCSVFLFQDDDFPVKTGQDSSWVITFCEELKKEDLDGRIMWKINCRPDEVEEDLFKLMKYKGLFLVFLGVDDGTEEGLKRLNKHLTIERSISGIDIIKKLQIGFDYGFMLFQPSSTYLSININLDFLRIVCGDGYTPLTYLKLMPYYETQVERDLINEGRLKNIPGCMDYDFTDESMNLYYGFTADCFREWQRAPDGFVNISKWARNYFAVYLKYFGLTEVPKAIQNDVTKTISEGNMFLLNIMKELARGFASGEYKSESDTVLKDYRQAISLKHKYLCGQVHASMNRLFYFAPDFRYV